MTAPLARDKQIEMMATAAERHATFVRRWAADRQVQQVVRERALSEDQATYVRRDMNMRKCG